ncbi:hypothetical protein L6452_28347 [Arctium lappa]|uniref:Uncharacterized protein n=1 Tax=Arctium lappa TaxID=4217 RepID=A0ACB8ZYP4_ARCLA|nr:hypothetical protein L6452_28347 [Arctium lappa]
MEVWEIALSRHNTFLDDGSGVVATTKAKEESRNDHEGERERIKNSAPHSLCSSFFINPKFPHTQRVPVDV